MVRLFFGTAGLLGLVLPCCATSIRDVSFPELVSRADVIVLGTVLKAGNLYSAKVAETLAGTVGQKVVFIVPRWQEFSLRAGQTQVFFLLSRNGELSLLHPAAYADPNAAAETRRLVDMKTHPKKYFDNPKQASTPDFLEILGFAFADCDQVGKLTKPDVVEHLRRCLLSEDAKVVLQALAGLQRTASKQTAVSVIPLIRYPNDQVRLAAVEFLEWSLEERDVGPLCQALDESAKGGKLGPVIGRALGRFRDPTAVPALERAVKRGVGGWTCWALGTLGREHCFDLLLDQAEKHDSLEAAGGLMI